MADSADVREARAVAADSRALMIQQVTDAWRSSPGSRSDYDRTSSEALADPRGSPDRARKRLPGLNTGPLAATTRMMMTTTSFSARRRRLKLRVTPTSISSRTAASSARPVSGFLRAMRDPAIRATFGAGRTR